MHANVGARDARVRWALAAVFFAVAIAFNASPAITLMAALAALLMAGTALTRSCPLYRLLGIHAHRPKVPAPRS
jgi:Inner membrane protein YgaP-like, transmembrane domain